MMSESLSPTHLTYRMCPAIIPIGQMETLRLRERELV